MKGIMTTKKVDKSLDIKINEKEVDPALFGTIVNAIASFFRNKKWEQEFIDQNEDEVEQALGLKEDDPDEDEMPVMKALNSELRQATYVVLEPDVVDLHEDTYSAVEVSKACHNFWTFCQKAYIDHADETSSAKIVENYIAPVDMKIGDKKVSKGTWLQVWQFDETLWQSVKDGTYTGVSIGAYAKTEELE